MGLHGRHGSSRQLLQGADRSMQAWKKLDGRRRGRCAAPSAAFAGHLLAPGRARRTPAARSPPCWTGGPAHRACLHAADAARARASNEPGGSRVSTRSASAGVLTSLIHRHIGGYVQSLAKGCDMRVTDTCQPCETHVPTRASAGPAAAACVLSARCPSPQTCAPPHG